MCIKNVLSATVGNLRTYSQAWSISTVPNEFSMILISVVFILMSVFGGLPNKTSIGMSIGKSLK